MKKKLLLTVLSAVLILCLLAFPVSAEEATSGACGDDLTWALEDGTLTISGTGEMYLYDQTHTPWYNLSFTTLVVEEGVTGLCDYAFFGAEELTSVILPSSLAEIASMAFNGTGLKQVELPMGFVTIDDGVFGNCSALTKVVIPYTVTEIAEDAFVNSENLTIHCYELTHAHLFAEAYEIPYVFLPDPDQDAYHTAQLDCGKNGKAQLSSDTAHTGQYVLISVEADQGSKLSRLMVYYDSEVELELYLQQVDESTYAFIMPNCDVRVEIDFFNPTNPFVDVKESDYFYDSVLWAYNHSITAGMDETHFAPNNACTRAQVVTFLWRACGEPEPTATKNPFVDVKETDYFYKAVLWAVENGITAGMDATHFGPGTPCTRAQVATFLWRLFDSPAPTSSDNPFSDVKSGAYYHDAVLWAVENGITAGMGNGTFAPNATCTRGQIVTFLYRALAY